LNTVVDNVGQHHTQIPNNVDTNHIGIEKSLTGLVVDDCQPSLPSVVGNALIHFKQGEYQPLQHIQEELVTREEESFVRLQMKLDEALEDLPETDYENVFSNSMNDSDIYEPLVADCDNYEQLQGVEESEQYYYSDYEGIDEVETRNYLTFEHEFKNTKLKEQLAVKTAEIDRLHADLKNGRIKLLSNRELSIATRIRQLKELKTSEATRMISILEEMANKIASDDCWRYGTTESNAVTSRRSWTPG